MESYDILEMEIVILENGNLIQCSGEGGELPGESGEV